MINIKNKYNCSGCAACANICPKKCITLRSDSEGFCYPEVDKTTCINCGLCEKVCPVINGKKDTNKKPDVFAAYSKNLEIRKKSSSGGIFSELANHILAIDGVVAGVKMSADNRKAKHVIVTNKEELNSLRGSKYVMSETSGIYQDIKRNLDQGIIVLYGATPCQIEGLKGFLQKEYDNLFTVDFVCHGSPSGKLWNKYLDYQEELNKAKVKEASFRDKTNGWVHFSQKLKFDNGYEYISALEEDPYLRMFLMDVALRPICYKCPFKKVGRISDITLADYWGYEKTSPEFNDDLGLSEVIIHSEKGKRLFKEISNNLTSKELKYEESVPYNVAYTHSAIYPVMRNEFMRHLNSKDFRFLIDKYLHPSKMRRIGYIIRPLNIKRIILRTLKIKTTD